MLYPHISNDSKNVYVAWESDILFF